MTKSRIADILDVVIACYPLKDTERTGWVKQDIRQKRHPHAVESVAEHTALMHTLALFFAPLYNERAVRKKQRTLDVGKLHQLIAVHDLAEAKTGDIASDGTENRALKFRNEEAVMTAFAEKAKQPSLLALWHEFEAAPSLEAKFGRDLDKLEMFVQAYLYQKAHPDKVAVLDRFWENDAPKIKTDFGKEILAELMKRRHALTGGKSFTAGVSETPAKARTL